MFKLISSIFVLALLINGTVSVHLRTDTDLVTDPCGLVFFRGQYHLFYQFFIMGNHPRDEQLYTRVNWGHATSDDMIKWKKHDVVIRGTNDPTPTFFHGQRVNVSLLVPFSGSAIVDARNDSGLMKRKDEPVLLVFVSMSKFLLNITDPITNQEFIYSSQDMFYSYDSFNFKRFERPMIEKSEFFRNFRDPNVFRFGDQYNLIMVENTRFGIYRSKDLINWKKVSVVLDPKLPEEVVEVETPSLAVLGNQTLLVHSVHRELGNYSAQNFYGSTRYYVGTFDGTHFKIDEHQWNAIEFDGPDLYAVSVTNGTLLGMINNQNYARFLPYNGSITYPRRLSTEHLNGLTYLRQEFIRLEAFDEERLDKRSMVDEEIVYAFTVNKPHYLKLKLRNLACENECDFQLKFRDEPSNNTLIIGYTGSSKEFYVDRTRGKPINSRYNEVHRYKPKYKKLLSDDEFAFDIVLDVDTIELLTDRGLVALTMVHLNHRIFETLTISTLKNYEVDLKVNTYES